MAKKIGFKPSIILRDIGIPGDDVVIGGGTGQSTTDPFPCSYAEWQIMFIDDYDLDDDYDFDDYGQWWADNGFSLEDWVELNPDVDFIWE